MKINRMEDCVHLICESLGLQEDDEVGIEMICSLYNSIFLISSSLEDTKKAISQVRGETGGLSCSARSVLHVLLMMERQRENREVLYWDLQMLKVGRINCPLKHNIQSHTISYSHQQQEQDTEQYNILYLQNKAKRLYIRLVLDGVWTLLPSLSQNKVSMRQGNMCHNSSDILQLLHYKYDIIKERLYQEMLQEEYGMDWWNSLSPWQQTECVCEMGTCIEEAYRRRDWVKMCGLPGALRCYRSCGSVVLQGSTDSLKPRDQAWSCKPNEQAWTALICLSELESVYQEEKESLITLIHRIGQEALRVIYLSICVAVRRAERETQSQAVLLVARQHWHRWPFMRGSVSQELARIWLQENLDLVAKKEHSWKTGSCMQQTVLQLLVLCQEQERKRLVEILHRVSLTEVQDVNQGNTAEQSCVSRLQQMKVSLQEAQGSHGPMASGFTGVDVSWGECAMHLLTQLTLAHEDETWTVLHSLQDPEPGGLLNLLHKYQKELHTPSFHNLCDVLQSRAPAQSTAEPNAERERAEYIQEESLDSDKQALCTGCGMALDPEDTPYLEIVCVRDPRDEVSTMETRDGEREEIYGVTDSRENNEEISVEKQNSLITLAWSKPVHGENQIQEVTSSVQEEESSPTTVQERPSNTIQNKETQCEVKIYTHHKNINSIQAKAEETQTTQDHPAAGHPEEDVREEHLTIQPDTDHQQPVTTVSTQSTDTTDTITPPASSQSTDQVCDVHEMEASQQEQRREEETGERGGEEQQLQREATMQCLVNIQRRAERRWQRDRDRQLLRVQERLAIVQSRKADEDLLGLTHLTDTLRQEDEQQQKTLVREKLEQMRRERSCILQTRRERNTTGFKELIAPTAQHMAEAEESH